MFNRQLDLIAHSWWQGNVVVLVGIEFICFLVSFQMCCKFPGNLMKVGNKVCCSRNLSVCRHN